ncbi:MAG: radical SAM protein [Pseudomonadota bacterium]
MFVQIEISTHCNFTCFYCAGRDMAQEYMPIEQFDAIMARLPPGRHTVCLQGEGEPMLHPHFWTMVERVLAHGHIPDTITNGSRIDPEKIAALFPRIAVSIDTLDPVEAERIGRKKLGKVLHNLDRLIEHMGASRLVITTVDYGQPLDALKNFVRAKGIGQHMVQPLQIKEDYRRRYPDRAAPDERYTYRCRYLEQPLQRTYGMDGREFPCCYIKDPTGYQSIETLRASLAAQIVPSCCNGCREILADAPKPYSMIDTAGRPTVSFIVPVKGRLDQLRQTLPRLIRLPDCEVVVVDYDCPDDTKNWVVATYPRTRVVHVRNAPLLNLSHARNLGSMHAQGEWLCFLDADALLEANFLEQARPALLTGSFAQFAVDGPGQVLCLADDFRRLGGFDETFEGWGCADNDLLMRLTLAGRRCQLLPQGLLKLMPHDDGRRMVHYAYPDKWISLRINGLYFQIKTDLARQQGMVELPRTQLAPIYQRIKEAVLASPRTATEIKLTLPAQAGFRQPSNWTIEREWIYRVQVAAAESA